MITSRKKSSNKYGRQHKAIDEVKSHYPQPSGEPHILDDQVSLRELVYALELLEGFIPSTQNGLNDPSVIQKVMGALIYGRLVARTRGGNIPNGKIIPKNSWPIAKAGKLGTANAYDDGVWLGVIYFDHHCRYSVGVLKAHDIDSYVGVLPVIDRHDAEVWLSTAVKGKSGRPNKQAAARRAYDQIYPYGHMVAGDRMKVVLRKVSQITGETISINTMKAALKN